MGQDVQAISYWPPESNPDVHHDSVSTRNEAKQPWILVNSTPATCAQLGLSHFFNDRGPIELVISGPNYGRNTTAVFALSSGTLGAALEACVCGYHTIGLSFAFFDRKNEPDVVNESCTQAVRVCEWLAKNGNWADARLYSVNVPVKQGVTERKIVWTKMLQNQWKKGACFQEMSGPDHVDDPNAEEAKLRAQESGNGEAALENGGNDRWKTRHFKWAPRFTDVYDSVEQAGPGSDGWTVRAGETSITALHANFMHAQDYEGELDLSSS